MVALGILIVVGAHGAPTIVLDVPTERFPCERVAGLSIMDHKWLVGGIRGLYLGSPDGTWKEVSKQSVRQVVASGKDSWVLYGNGSVDKANAGEDRLYYDVFHGAVKRPWVASISPTGAGLTFGGHGGWFDRIGAKPVKETYPEFLGKREVTSQLIVGGTRYVGTQDGLFVFGAKGGKRLGFGDGLADTWITDIVRHGSQVLVGTYTGGAYEIDRGKAKAIEVPNRNIRHLLNWNGMLVVGALHGTWIQHDGTWTLLSKMENTFLADINHQLVVGTVGSIRFFK